MSDPFYRSRKWRKKREYILHRDQYLCQECTKYGRNTEAKIVHHLKEMDEYPELTLTNENLVRVCASCHNKEHPEKGGHYLKK